MCIESEIVSMNGKNKKKIAMLLCAVLLVSVLTACGDGLGVLNSKVAPMGEFPVTVGGVELKSAPQKVAVLSPNVADVVLALGEETRLVAVSNDCTQGEYEQHKKVDKSDAEAIKNTGTDLILVDDAETEHLQKWKDTGIAVVVVSPAKNREDLERLYGEVSSVFEGGGAGYEAGQAGARKIFTRLDDVERISKQDIITTACYLYDIYELEGDDNGQSGKAITGDQFGSVVMTSAGLTNIFMNNSNGEYKISTLLQAQPDIVFCAPGLKGEIEKSETLANLYAVRNQKVYELEPYMIEWQGRTTTSTAIVMAGNAFPELMEEASQEPTDPIEEIESKVSQETGSETSKDSSSGQETSKAEGETSGEESSSSSTSVGGNVLYTEGDAGENVLEVQRMLAQLGYLNADYDGHYGSFTTEAVKTFQTANNLKATGSIDQETLDALKQAAG